MNHEKIHLYFLSGIVCIIVGIVSLIYSYVIPTASFPYNVPSSLTFTIIGIVLIIIGIVLSVFRKKLTHDHGQSVETKGG